VASYAVIWQAATAEIWLNKLKLLAFGLSDHSLITRCLWILHRPHRRPLCWLPPPHAYTVCIESL